LSAGRRPRTSAPPAGFARLLAGRTTVREFSGPPVPAATVRRVLDLARRAPSEFNLQPWRVLVCHRAADRRRLRACCLDQAQVEAAGAVFVVFGSRLDPVRGAARAARQLEAGGRLHASTRGELEALIRDYYADPTNAWRSAFRSAVIFAHQLLLAGLAVGLQGFWLAGLDEAALRRRFAIPDDLVLAGVIGLGHGGRPGPRLPRRPRRDLQLEPSRRRRPAARRGAARLARP
jgi:nitroreductase